MADVARTIARNVEEFGSAWEGATMRDNRAEIPRIEPTPKPPGATALGGTGVLLVLGALLLLATWR